MDDIDIRLWTCRKPSRGSCELSLNYKCWARSVQQFLRFLGRKQTNKQTDTQSINIDSWTSHLAKSQHIANNSAKFM